MVGEYLRPHDRLEVIESNELYALYDHGIRVSSGQIVLITEAHVQAGRRVLERLLDVFEATGCRAACCRAVAPKREGYLATMEGWLFAEEVAGWGDDGHRRRLLERGFAIRRDTYLEYGGFPHEHGLFAGRIFGSRLEAADVYVPYVRNAAVVHYNSTSLDDIYEGVRSFTCGELAYRRCGDAEHVQRYFGSLPIIAECDLYRRSLARQWLRGRLATMANRRTVRRRDLREVALLAIGSIFGFGWAVAEARIAIWVAAARIHLLRPFGARAGIEAFRDLWHRRLVRYHALKYLAGIPLPQLSVAKDRYDAGDEGCFVGFYEREVFEDAGFRWGKPLAALRVRLKTAAPSRLTLRLLPVGAPLATRGIALYLDGNRLKALTYSEDGSELTVGIPNLRGTAEVRTLTIVCDPLATPGTNDCRELGIALQSVEFG